MLDNSTLDGNFIGEDDNVLVDLRRYTVVPGRLKSYLAVYEELGLPVQRRHLGHPLGYFISEVGILNQVVHLWGYADFGERMARRAAMEADPQWTEYKKVTLQGQYIEKQENQILLSAPWSQI